MRRHQGRKTSTLAGTCFPPSADGAGELFTRSPLMEMNVPISADGDDLCRPPALPRTRKTSKVILDFLGVSCQVEPTTAAEVAPLNQLAEDHGPVAAVAANALAESIVTIPVPPPPSAAALDPTSN